MSNQQLQTPHAASQQTPQSQVEQSQQSQVQRSPQAWQNAFQSVNIKHHAQASEKAPWRNGVSSFLWPPSIGLLPRSVMGCGDEYCS